MKLLSIIKLAWRNIWRNKRRTLITASSIVFAVLLVSVFQSIQTGAWDNMMNNVINSYQGFVQIHKKGFTDESTLNNAFEVKSAKDILKGRIEGADGYVSRLESFAMASSGELTRPIAVVGTDPAAEDKLTQLSERVIKGAYFKSGDKGIMVGAGVAELLHLSLNDTLILIGQGYHGVNAAGKYAITAIVKFPSPELNRRLAFLPLEEAQKLYGAEGLATGMVVNVKDRYRVPKVMTTLKSQLPQDQFEVLDWEEMMPELVQAKTMDEGSGKMIYFILFIVITFGIFGTILMMTKERQYEFGVLISIGMRRMRLFFTVWLEILFMAFLGTAVGLLLSFPVVKYLEVNPIDFSQNKELAKTYEKMGFEPVFPAAFKPEIFVDQAIFVFIIVTILAIYPLFKIWFIKPVEAMRI